MLSLFDSRRPLYNFLRECTSGDVRRLRSFLKQWKKLGLSPMNWFDGLSVACKFGHQAAVQVLLRIYEEFPNSVRRDILRDYSQSIIRYTVQHNMQHVLTKLKIEPRLTFSGYTELVIGTSIRGDLQTLRTLLSNIPFPNEDEEDVEILFWDAFDYACFGGHRPVMEWLAKFATDSQHQIIQLNYESALFFAGASNRRWVIEWLLEKRPNANKSKVFEGAIRCGNLQLAKEYAPFITRYETWNNALINSASHGYSEVVRWILKSFSEIPFPFPLNLASAAMAAAGSHEWAIAYFLLNEGATNYQDVLRKWISDDEDLLSFHLKDLYPETLRAEPYLLYRKYPRNRDFCAALQDEMSVVHLCVLRGARFGRCRLGTASKEKKIWEFFVWYGSKYGTDNDERIPCVMASAFEKPDVITKRIHTKYVKWKQQLQNELLRYHNSDDLCHLVCQYC